MTDGEIQIDAPVEPETPATPAEPQIDEGQGDNPQPETPAEPAEPNKGAGQRIKELNQQVKSLSDRINELTQDDGNTQTYVPRVQPGEEITQERYQQDVTQTADSLVKLRMKQYEAESRIKTESSEVVKVYPQLDPSAKEFDADLSDTITEAVEAHIRVNPYNASVKKFVDRLMKPYAKAVEKEVGQARETIAKQVTQTALRPTQVKKQEKSANEKSIAELEAELGIVNS